MIVGTAGHVDHGKTALVRALTGVDTDRLKEEKARGITLDLGFAYMPGADGATIGFVDVPGHERLVRTMVAGAAGIDFALLVIAGDDGVMPQTREHLEILGLLGLRRGLVAISKCDRIDGERRAAVRREVEAALAGSALEGADILFVSALAGEGLDTLRARITGAATNAPPEADGMVFRMPVDRAFTLDGVGTVVTGTVVAGRVRVGDEVMVLPAGAKARVRSLHAQNHEATSGVAGERCALALAGAGVSKEIVSRGGWIGGADVLGQTTRFDARVRLLAGERRALGQWTPVHLHCGASDVGARVVVLSADTLPPGEEALVQVVLEHPLPLRHGDLFVLRDQSAQRTIGGGDVLDPRAPVRRRRAPDRLARLDALLTRDPAKALARLLALDPGFEDLTGFAADRGLAAARAEALIAPLRLGTLRVGAGTIVHTAERWAALRGTVVALLGGFHADNPELPGLAGERLRLQLTPMLTKPLFAAVRDRLVVEKVVVLQGHWLRLPEHVAQFGAEDRRVAGLVKPMIAAERFRPPRVRDLSNALAVPEPRVRSTCKALARAGELMEVAPDQFFLRGTVVEMAEIAETLSTGAPFNAADFRDRLDNGRKVAIQILEFFDRQGFTHRTGDLRRVVKAPEAMFGRR